jgi:hypothetical protein
MRVAQTLYGVIMSHLKSTNVERPEKHLAETYIQDQIKAILAPKIMAIQHADNPEEAIADLILNLDEATDDDLLGEHHHSNTPTSKGRGRR